MSRPVFQQQGPADNCVIGGKNLGWLSCTSYSAAMAIDAASSGEHRPTGCQVRKATGDTIGGLMLSQVEPVIESYGIPVRRKTGSNYATADFLAKELRALKPTVLQGNTGVLIGTAHQSTAGYVNHAVCLDAETRGWRTVSGLYRPDAVLVFDPAADGRGDFAQGPQWWSWSTVMKFAGALRPWGDNDPRVLGLGKAYAAFLTPKAQPKEEIVGSIPESDGPYPCTVKAGTPWYRSATATTASGTLNDVSRPYTVTGASDGSTKTSGRRSLHGRYTGTTQVDQAWVAVDRIVR